jgi:hypothetical protein
MRGGPNFLFHPQPKTTWHGPDCETNKLLTKLFALQLLLQISPATFRLDNKYKLFCGWKAIRLRFVSGYISKIEPNLRLGSHIFADFGYLYQQDVATYFISFSIFKSF